MKTRPIKSAFIGGVKYELQADYPEGLAARFRIYCEGWAKTLSEVYAVTQEDVFQAYLTASTAFNRILCKALSETRTTKHTLCVAREVVEHCLAHPDKPFPRPRGLTVYDVN